MRAIHSNLLELEGGGKWRVLRGEACGVSEATADPQHLCNSPEHSEKLEQS